MSNYTSTKNPPVNVQMYIDRRLTQCGNLCGSPRQTRRQPLSHSTNPECGWLRLHSPLLCHLRHTSSYSHVETLISSSPYKPSSYEDPDTFIQTPSAGAMSNGRVPSTRTLRDRATLSYSMLTWPRPWKKEADPVRSWLPWISYASRTQSMTCTIYECYSYVIINSQPTPNSHYTQLYY